MKAVSSGIEEIKYIKLRHKGQDFNLFHKGQDFNLFHERNLGYEFENNYDSEFSQLSIEFEDSIEIDMLINILQEFKNNVVKWGGIWKNEEEAVRSDF